MQYCADEVAAVVVVLYFPFFFVNLLNAIFPVFPRWTENKPSKTAPELCCMDVHPTCFVRKHQGVLSKSLSRQEDERRCGAVAHPFPVSSSKHRQNSFSNHRGAGEDGGGEKGCFWITELEHPLKGKEGAENGSRAWSFSNCVVLLATPMSGGEQGFWLCIRNHENKPTTA